MDTIWQTDQEVLLSTPDTMAFLKLVLSGKYEYLNPDVAEVIEAVREELVASCIDYDDLIERVKNKDNCGEAGGKKCNGYSRG